MLSAEIFTQHAKPYVEKNSYLVFLVLKKNASCCFSHLLLISCIQINCRIKVTIVNI